MDKLEKFDFSSKEEKDRAIDKMKKISIEMPKYDIELEKLIEGGNGDWNEKISHDPRYGTSEYNRDYDKYSPENYRKALQHLKESQKENSNDDKDSYTSYNVRLFEDKKGEIGIEFEEKTIYYPQNNEE